MRPPYGAINPRVRGIVRRQGLVPVLWTDRLARLGRRHALVRSPRAVLRQPRAGTARTSCSSTTGSGAPRSRSPQCPGSSTAPVAAGSASPPSTVRDGRRRRSRSCGSRSRPGARPVGCRPRSRSRLSQPTSRPVSVRVSTVAGSARPRQDFVPVSRTVVFPVGSTRRDGARPGGRRRTLRAGPSASWCGFGAARGLRSSAGHGRWPSAATTPHRERRPSRRRPPRRMPTRV